MIPRPLAQVLEHMPSAVELLHHRRRHALAPHLGISTCVAPHPACHHMTPDPAHRAAALGHFGRGIVRAARAEIGRARGSRHVQDGRLFRQQRAGLFFQPLLREKPRQTLGHHRHQHQGAQLARPRQQRLTHRAILAHHLLGLGAGPVIEILLELALDDTALFLDHQHLALAGHEGQRIAPPQRPDHADLVNVDPQPPTGRFVQLQQAQRLHQVQMPLARGDKPVNRVIDVIDAPVNRVRLDKGFHRAQLVPDPSFDLGAGQVAGPHMQPAGGHVELRGHELSVGLQIHRPPRFHRFRDRLEPHPCPGKPRQGKAVFAKRQVFFHAGRVQRWHEPRHERHIRLMRHRRAHAPVVIPCHNQHATPGRRAIGIAMFESITRPIHTRPLAVPHGKQAVIRAIRVQHRLLRTQNRRRPQILVHRGQKGDLLLLGARLLAPELQIQRPKRRAAIARHETARVQPRGPIPARLVKHDPRQSLRSG